MGEDAALGRLQAILARPEYRVDDSVPWWQQLLQPVFDFLWQLLGDLWQLIVASATGREGSIGTVVALACVAVLALVGVYLARAVRLSMLRDDELRRGGLAERRERSDHLWALAQRLAAEGELAEAVRALYLSALYALDEHAVLHVEQNLTNREHAARLRARDASLAANFADLVDLYERVRYGHAAVAPTMFEDLSSRAQRIRTAALAPAAV
jgi:Domain of unknown function (DUF4129)